MDVESAKKQLTSILVEKGIPEDKALVLAKEALVPYGGNYMPTYKWLMFKAHLIKGDWDGN